MKASFFNGSINLLDRDIIRNCSADFIFNLQLNKQLSLDKVEDYIVNCSFDLVGRTKTIEHCFLFGKAIQDKGRFKIRGSNNFIAVNIYKDSSCLKLSSLIKSNIVNNMFELERKVKGTGIINCLIDTKNWLYELRAKLNKFSTRDKRGLKIKFDDLRFIGSNSDKNEQRLLIKDFAAKRDLADFRYKDKKVFCRFKGDSLLQKLFSINGPCDLEYSGILKDNTLTGRLRSTKLSLIFPKIYNVLKNLDIIFSYNFSDKAFFINNFLLKWNKGDMRSQNVLLNLNLEKPISLPFALSNFFFSPTTNSSSKNFFVYLNGPLDLVYSHYNNDKKLILSGTLDIDKGGVKYYFNSDKKIDNSKREFDLNLNLNVTSKNILMNHKFFDLNFMSKLNINGTLQNPQISGIVNITDGIFKFPSNNLAITQARIYLSEEKINLDINAKGAFNKYDISMRILGPISDPKITFESNPLLSTEQIISLLVTGSQNSALNCFIPNSLIQNLPSLIFGVGTKEPKVENTEPSEYIKHLLNVLKNMRVKSIDRGKFNDKSYIFELDILHGLKFTMNKDLNLEQPKQIALEYELSNGITLKGSRDKNNNIGGDLEWRLKF